MQYFRAMNPPADQEAGIVSDHSRPGRSGVSPNEVGHRIIALTAQLLRAEDPQVVELVAAELQGSIREHLEQVRFRIADSVPMLAGAGLQKYT